MWLYSDIYVFYIIAGYCRWHLHTCVVKSREFIRAKILIRNYRKIKMPPKSNGQMITPPLSKDLSVFVIIGNENKARLVPVHLSAPIRSERRIINEDIISCTIIWNTLALSRRMVGNRRLSRIQWMNKFIRRCFSIVNHYSLQFAFATEFK